MKQYEVFALHNYALLCVCLSQKDVCVCIVKTCRKVGFIYSTCCLFSFSVTCFCFNVSTWRPSSMSCLIFSLCSNAFSCLSHDTLHFSLRSTLSVSFFRLLSVAGRLHGGNGQLGDLPLRLDESSALQRSGPALLTVLEFDPLLSASSGAFRLAGPPGRGEARGRRGEDERERRSVGLSPAEPAAAHRSGNKVKHRIEFGR